MMVKKDTGFQSVLAQIKKLSVLTGKMWWAEYADEAEIGKHVQAICDEAKKLKTLYECAVVSKAVKAKTKK